LKNGREGGIKRLQPEVRIFHGPYFLLGLGKLKAANFVSRASTGFWEDLAGRKTEKVPLHNALG
jgi:hypothetical protein